MKKDFNNFGKIYFPHYCFIKDESILQKELNSEKGYKLLIATKSTNRVKREVRTKSQTKRGIFEPILNVYIT